MKFSGCKQSVLLLLLALVVGACSEEKSPSPALEPPAQTAPSTQPSIDPAPATTREPVVVPVENRPPRVESVKLTPGAIFSGTWIKAEVVTSDPDDDLVMLDYEWRRNDQVIVEAVTDELDTSDFEKGDLITVGIIPFDGMQNGEIKRSLPVFILNRPPEITSFPPPKVNDGTYVYKVEADDPDGDEITYSLEAAPSGMVIDAASGQLEWEIPADLTGSFAVQVVVSDGDARSFQGFSLNLAKTGGQ